MAPRQSTARLPPARTKPQAIKKKPKPPQVLKAEPLRRSHRIAAYQRDKENFASSEAPAEGTREPVSIEQRSPHTSQQQEYQAPHAVLDIWLDRLVPTPPEPPSRPVDTFEQIFLQEMPENGTEEPIGAPTNPTESGKTNPEHLEKRLVKLHANPKFAKPEKGARVFGNIIPSEPFVAASEANKATIDELCALVKRFAGQFRHSKGTERDSLFHLLFDDIDDWKSNIGFARITPRDFHKDLALCRMSMANEATLQRTIMMHLIDPRNLDARLAYCCEGLWKFDSGYSFASQFEQAIGNIKPDLTVSFTFEALAGDEEDGVLHAPGDLQLFMSPDDCQERCFPFFFIEAKKSEDPLRMAKAQTMRDASQALWCIYKWMAKAQNPTVPQVPEGSNGEPVNAPVTFNYKNAFFENVRLFSYSMNGVMMEIRAHRAVPANLSKRPGSRRPRGETIEGIEGLRFLFEPVGPTIFLERDNLDRLCKIFRNITKYALEILLPLLKKAFSAVHEAYSGPAYRWEKPKPIPRSRASSKRGRSRTGVNGNEKRTRSEGGQQED